MNTGMESPQSVSSVVYYRGVSITITKRDQQVDVMPIIRAQMKDIDELLALGCLPSWNSETNAAAKATPIAQQASTPLAVDDPTQEPPHPAVQQPINLTTVCPLCKGAAMQRSGMNKLGKPYNGIFCQADKKHVTWL